MIAKGNTHDARLWKYAVSNEAASWFEQKLILSLRCQNDLFTQRINANALKRADSLA